VQPAHHIGGHLVLVLADGSSTARVLKLSI
jgi:hypothetical protein